MCPLRVPAGNTQSDWAAVRLISTTAAACGGSGSTRRAFCSLAVRDVQTAITNFIPPEAVCFFRSQRTVDEQCRNVADQIGVLRFDRLSTAPSRTNALKRPLIG